MLVVNHSLHYLSFIKFSRKWSHQNHRRLCLAQWGEGSTAWCAGSSRLHPQHWMDEREEEIGMGTTSQTLWLIPAFEQWSRIGLFNGSLGLCKETLWQNRKRRWWGGRGRREGGKNWKLERKKERLMDPDELSPLSNKYMKQVELVDKNMCVCDCWDMILLSPSALAVMGQQTPPCLQTLGGQGSAQAWIVQEFSRHCPWEKEVD